jgi:hypothetical protein
MMSVVVHEGDPSSGPVSAGDRRKGRRQWVGGTEILSGRVRRALERHSQPGERPEFCLKGDFDHTLVALRDRLLIIKAGVFAGTTFRGASRDHLLPRHQASRSTQDS